MTLKLTSVKYAPMMCICLFSFDNLHLIKKDGFRDGWRDIQVYMFT